MFSMRFIDGSPVDDAYLAQLEEVSETHFSVVGDMCGAELDQFERNVEAYRQARKSRDQASSLDK